MEFLQTSPDDAVATLLLAHGAGAPMDTPFMNAVAEGVARHGIRCARFEFGYMAGRRTGEGRKPPPRAETVMPEFIAAVDQVKATGPLFIGGKSMGGRVASMVADELFRQRRIAGLVCLGYPFHPPEKPQQLRTAHLKGLVTPALICQGERDPFGTREEVAAYDLSPAIGFHWLEHGDHDFKPDKGSGRSARDNLASAIEGSRRGSGSERTRRASQTGRCKAQLELAGPVRAVKSIGGDRPESGDGGRDAAAAEEHESEACPAERAPSEREANPTNKGGGGSGAVDCPEHLEHR